MQGKTDHRSGVSFAALYREERKKPGGNEIFMRETLTAKSGLLKQLDIKLTFSIYSVIMMQLIRFLSIRRGNIGFLPKKYPRSRQGR